MADNKKYYYMKLNENYFESETQVLLESMPDGYLYSNILLKLYLKSLKNDGKLMFNEKIPYSPQMIATITRHQIGTVEKALKIFRDLNIIEILNTGAIFVTDIQKYIGKSTNEADRKRAYRKRIESEMGQMSSKCPLEIEIEKEIEIEIDKDIDKNRNVKKKYGEYNNVKLTEQEYEKLKNAYPNYEELITYLDEYIEMKGYKANSHYLAIKKWVVDALDNEKEKHSKGKTETEKRHEMYERILAEEEVKNGKKANN